jgi:hypothetical protein
MTECVLCRDQSEDNKSSQSRLLTKLPTSILNGNSTLYSQSFVK